MENVYILKDDLNKWVAKYFIKDIVSVDDLLRVIEDLDEQVESLKEELEEVKTKHEPDEWDAWHDNLLVR